MKPPSVVGRLGRRFTVTPVVAIGLALALLAASLTLGIHNERAARAELTRQVSVQARILAGSVAAPLAFDDRTATQEYVNALRANRDIEVAGAYDSAGALAAGYARSGAALPPTNRVGPPLFENGDLVVTAAVSQNGAKLGSVYLRSATESWFRRAMRYLGIALVMVMASLLVAVLGASYASAREAHRKLQEEIEGRQKAEEALRQSQKMEAMGQLTGGVAHDFNNLLMVASSGLELMDRTNDPVRRERLKQGIRQAIDRGASLTQQLLAFSRRSPMNPEVVDLGDHVHRMQDLLDRSLRGDISVDVQVAPNLWPVEVDPSQLEVAILNITLNARDAMPNGGVITIRIENEAAGALHPSDMVRLSIGDTGVGLAAEAITRAFEPFYTTKEVGQGTGLGLSQVYGFARASGGRAEIESQMGEGATVSVLLPRSAKALPAPVAPRLQIVPNAPRKCRVLLVEDDDNVADLVAQMLEELDYGSFRAPTAAAALAALNDQKSFDIVFSDMVMPGGMSGLELAREVARQRPELPIVLTTGYSAAAAAASAEGLRLLIKPYRIEALADALQEALTQAAA